MANGQRSTRISVSTNETPTVTSDSGRVRTGSLSPAFPPVRHTPANPSDTGAVRIGNMTPAFPPVRPTK
jgi:hypothetical protein